MKRNKKDNNNNMIMKMIHLDIENFFKFKMKE